MDKKIIGVIGAVSGLATLDGSAQAAPAAMPSPDMNARSFAELLAPIPNAVAALRAADAAARAAEEQSAVGEMADVKLAQYHHHHHHRSFRHHHHHHRAVERIIRRTLRRPHHHHHHHSHY